MAKKTPDTMALDSFDDLDIDDLEQIDEDDTQIILKVGLKPRISWRMVEQAREQSLLRRSLADFDEYDY